MPSYTCRVDADGKLQIPEEVREELGLTDGTEVRLDVVDCELRVRSIASMLGRVRAIARTHLAPDVSLADELVADRRAEAARD